MKRILLPLSLLILVLLLTGTAYASQPVTATGDLSGQTDSQVVVKIADGNTFLAITQSGSLTGDFVCDFTLEGTAVVHPLLDVNGEAIVTGAPCTVAGKTGTLTVRSLTQQPYPGGPSEGKLTILSGTGDLANLHGEGTFQATFSGVTFSGPYEIDYHYDP